MESASGFRSDAAPEMDAFLRHRGMPRRGVPPTQVVLARVAQSNALQQATADLRSDTISSHARTSNASWIKAYQSLLDLCDGRTIAHENIERPLDHAKR